MKYLMFVCKDAEPDTTPEEQTVGETTIDEWVEKNDAAGVRIMGEVLRPASEAVVVRKRNGEVRVTRPTDGPFTETAEWIVGFDVLECDDLDAAIAVAADHEMARGGRIELRQFHVWDE